MTETFFKQYIQENICADLSGLKNFSAKACPDHIIGFCNFMQPFQCQLWMSRIQRLEHQQYTQKFDQVKRAVALIIESPHKAEFADASFIAPAMGPTGENITQHLPNLLDEIGRQLSLEGKYTLILLNTIQQQCSLGELPKLYRDRVWRALWDYERDAFVRRLKSYKPAVLVEMCTASDGRKAKVRDVLKTEFADMPLFSTTHPAAWHYPSNRRLCRLV